MNTKPNVLIVDDRPENLLSVEAILEPLDIVIYKASSADAALRCILDVEFAVVLLDVEMPEVDGFETARLIRSRQRTRNVPIIFLTAIDRGDSSVQKGYELGAVDFLVKPVQPDILRWKVSVFAELSRKSGQERQLFEEQVARAEADAFARRAGLLANASSALSSSLNEDAMLTSLIQVLVPDWADCAVVYRVQHDQELLIDAFVHRDPSMDIRSHPMRSHAVSLKDRDRVLVRGFESRGPFVMIDISEKSASLSGMDRLHVDFFNAFGLQYGMFLPVRGRDSSIGVLALYRAPRRRFTSSDQTLAEDLTDRIALAVTNAQLYEASLQAGRAKDQFLAVVSHELRTPLTAILGWVHILLSKTLPPADVEKALHTIQRNAKQQSDLIGDILDFSRFATGQFSVKFEDVDVRSLVQQCIETCRPVAEQKGIRLNYTWEGETETAAGDPTRLQQVFSNLISNAVKFTPDGGSIDVTFSVNGALAEIQVRDTGLGIEPEFIHQVFDPFIQADSSSTRSHSGLGLGLAIVRHLVELHGGSISATSPGVGKGATFTVVLPLRKSQALAS